MRVREATNKFARDVMGAVIEKRDDGATRIERDGQSWFRVAVTPKTIMTSLGPATYRRARYRSGASGASPVPVDESLGLVDDYLTRPAAELGLLMMGHCTAREAAAFFAKTGAMTPSVSTLQRLTLSMHECWESLGPETLGSIREAEGIPQDATTASVSLDGVMVPLRPGEDGRAEASWREAACGTVSFHDAEGKRMKTLYLGRMPQSGKLTLKAQLASEVAHIRRARPEIGIVAVADGAADNWTFLETLSPETEVIDFWHACEHLQTASDHAVALGWFEKYREILRHDPRGVAKVIRALRHLRDAAATPDRAEIERELAFFRKHRHRMRYHALKEEGIAIGSGVVEAANKTLVTQRMKRSGMRWRIAGGQAVLTFRALIKSGRFERAWKAIIAATGTPANDNISPRAAAMAMTAPGLMLSLSAVALAPMRAAHARSKRPDLIRARKVRTACPPAIRQRMPERFMRLRHQGLVGRLDHAQADGDALRLQGVVAHAVRVRRWPEINNLRRQVPDRVACRQARRCPLPLAGKKRRKRACTGLSSRYDGTGTHRSE